MKIIINADDCGFNHTVNQHINDAIEYGKLTSTTIMANMDDLEGAFCLYEKYKDKVSFGVHLNLTEGEPILKSKVLVDFGLYSEENGRILFNGKKLKSYRNRRLPKQVKEEIYKELSAQIKKIQGGGVVISHLDSHHHIHTFLNMMGVIAQLSKDFNIYKVRRIRNYLPRSFSFYGRQTWVIMSRFYNNKYVMTDYFAGFKEFFEKPRLPFLKKNCTIELMTHPGHPHESNQKIETMMLNMTYPKDLELINYNRL